MQRHPVRVRSWPSDGHPGASIMLHESDAAACICARIGNLSNGILTYLACTWNPGGPTVGEKLLGFILGWQRMIHIRGKIYVLCMYKSWLYNVRCSIISHQRCGRLSSDSVHSKFQYSHTRDNYWGDEVGMWMIIHLFIHMWAHSSTSAGCHPLFSNVQEIKWMRIEMFRCLFLALAIAKIRHQHGMKGCA